MSAPGAGNRTTPLQRAPLITVLLLGLLLLPWAALAATSGETATKSGVTAYLGLMPAEIVRGHAPSHPEAQAHGGAPRGRHQYHLVVALFDATTGDRIENAKVGARVSGLGLAGSYKTLEPMEIAGTITYGNHFDLPSADKYRIRVDVERPQGVVKFDFAYDH